MALETTNFGLIKPELTEGFVKINIVKDGTIVNTIE